MEDLKDKKIKFNIEIDAEIKILERELINTNIARRDAFREGKQKWEDDGFSGPYNPNYKPAIQKFVDAAKLDHEEVTIKKKIKKVVEKVKEILISKEDDWDTKEHMEIDLKNAIEIVEKPIEEVIIPKEIIEELEEQKVDDVVEGVDNIIGTMIKPSEIKEDIKAAEIKEDHARAAADFATEKIEAAMLSVEDIMKDHADWIDKYEDKTGKKAIWRGVITNGFKDFIELNGLE